MSEATLVRCRICRRERLGAYIELRDAARQRFIASICDVCAGNENTLYEWGREQISNCAANTRYCPPGYEVDEAIIREKTKNGRR